ncbi:MAG: Fic family protein [Candidatus Burarchaeum sp.]|nr:Fic family protein [Candidatus Burarchaeum sp.]MDO8340190.1 Fic family protein [Candidatus Burarchaeum sp.]
MGIRRKQVNGQQYYYLEESIRLEKPKVYSIFLGKRIPTKGILQRKNAELLEKMYVDLLGSISRVYLTKEELIEAEKRRRRYEARVSRMGAAARNEKDEVDTVNFVYATLTTEGVPITRQDAELAYKFSQKDIRSIRDENLRVALDMIKGLRQVKESPKGMTLGFLLKLHQTIMGEYKAKKPGQFRTEQAYIYLKSFEKAEEIGFRPPPPAQIRGKMQELVSWYAANLGRLNAIELAALLHLRFYMIHPFADGNKRMSRLLLNKALFDSGYPLLNVSKDTEGYFDALIKSVEKKDEKSFVEFVFKCFVQAV